MHQISLELVDSTNTYAKIHCKEFPRNRITCITANEQTAGRGRYQRKWISPKGVNIYATFYFSLPLSFPYLISLSQTMGSTLSRLLVEEGCSPKIKWPNDLMLNGKKTAGILTESVFQKEWIDIFLGVGINLNLERDQAETIDQPATSLLIETGKTWDRSLFLKKLQELWAADFEIFKQKGFAPFRKSFEDRLAFKGESIRFWDGAKTWTGICHSVTDEGKLNLLLPDQSLYPVSSGEINRVEG